MIDGQEIVTQPLGMNLVRDERNKLLADMDWLVIKHYSQGTAVPEDIATYMQELRDLPENCVPEVDEAGNLLNGAEIFPNKP